MKRGFKFAQHDVEFPTFYPTCSQKIPPSFYFYFTSILVYEALLCTFDVILQFVSTKLARLSNKLEKYFCIILKVVNKSN